MLDFNSFLPFSYLLLVKIGLLIILGLYIFFALLVFKQVSMMTEAVNNNHGWFFRLLGLVHLLVSIMIFLLALITL